LRRYDQGKKRIENREKTLFLQKRNPNSPFLVTRELEQICKKKDLSSSSENNIQIRIPKPFAAFAFILCALSEKDY